MSLKPQILFITSTRIGDAILSTGLLNYFWESEPEAEFTIVCGPLAQDLFTAIPRVQAIHVLKKQAYKQHWFKLLNAVMTKRWDRVIDLRSSLVSWLCWTRHRHVLQSNKKLHRVVHIGSLLAKTQKHHHQPQTFPPAPRLWIGGDSQAEALSFLPNNHSDNRSIISICTSANWSPKIWPEDNFIALIKCLTAPNGPFPNSYILLHGALNENEKIQKIKIRLPHDQVISFVGCTLQVAAAALQKSVLYIGNDSGLTHLAAAAGTPTVSIFGPTNETLYAPWGNHCIAVRGDKSYQSYELDATAKSRSDNSMISGPDVDKVYTETLKLLTSLHKV